MTELKVSRPPMEMKPEHNRELMMDIHMGIFIIFYMVLWVEEKKWKS